MKIRMTLTAAFAAMVIATMPVAVLAGVTEDVKSINDGWAHIVYEVRGSSTQTKALDALAKQAAQIVARNPGKAEPLLWQGSSPANRPTARTSCTSSGSPPRRAISSPAPMRSIRAPRMAAPR
ncbi:hypothetical protein [Sphingopyxis sp.]|uniref:hypothetical protein n=1 Tax=Sphingopyxis sp. TaxID=1908224 RepID=UPI0025D96C6D|nr:hypothetical protein [Sphingopyxis sp.]